MTNNVAKNEAGFSLIEIMIAMTILAIGLLATAGMQITALQSNAGAQKMTTINAVAAGVMEEILTWAPDDPRLVVADPAVAYAWDFDPTTTVNNTLAVSGGGRFVARYFVRRNFPTTSISTVTLVVDSADSFTAWGGSSRTLTCLKKTQ